MMSPDAKPDRPPSEQMEEMLAGHFVAQCLHVAASLGIPDLIAGGRDTASALAEATGCDGAALQRVLRTLASKGVFDETSDGHFALTPLGDTLRSDAPGSLRHKAMCELSAPFWAAAGGLAGTLRSGKPSFPEVNGIAIYGYLAKHPELAALFNDFMTAQSAMHNAAIVEAYDFSDIRTLVDVGGGHGATLAAILKRYPDMHGILFDLPQVVAGATFASPDIAGRCELQGGDMLSAVPGGADAWIIKRVMMDKTDEDVVTVLRNCAAGMRAGGRVLIIDPMLPEPGEPHPNWTTDILMMVVTEGGCRSRSQFQRLFEAAGMRLTQVIATASPNVILEGRPGRP